jgi:hypothetical protein
METQTSISSLSQAKKKGKLVQYESLEAALKTKNDMARNYLKTAQLPKIN